MELSQSGLRHTGSTAGEEMQVLSCARTALPGVQAVRRGKGEVRNQRKAVRMETEIRGGGVECGGRS